MGAAAAAASMSASAKTMLGLLPPSSRVSRFTRSAHLAMICLPTRVDPVKTILATPGCSTSALPATSPAPGSTWKRCSGRPASRASPGEPEGGERGGLGGFEEDGVAGGEGGGGAPGRDRHREVPRGDHSDDAERFEEGEVDAARHGDLASRQAFHSPGRVVQQVPDVGGLPARVAQGVAGFGDLQEGQFLGVFVDADGEAAQQAGAVAGCQGGPGALGGRGPCDGGVHLGDGGGGDGGDELLGRRIQDAVFVVHGVPHRRSKERRSSQSVTAASKASSSTRAMLR